MIGCLEAVVNDSNSFYWTSKCPYGTSISKFVSPKNRWLKLLHINVFGLPLDFLFERQILHVTLPCDSTSVLAIRVFL